jgi:hypothetical protein
MVPSSGYHTGGMTTERQWHSAVKLPLSTPSAWVVGPMLVDTYATMLNRKLVIPSTKPHYVAVEKKYWTEFFGLRIAHIDIDEAWYLARYPDVAQAIEDKIVDSARQHYCQSGYFEHRMPYYIGVESDWYLTQYKDVKEAIDNKVFAASQDHFELIGFREGRHPYPHFALRMTARASS